MTEANWTINRNEHLEQTKAASGGEHLSEAIKEVFSSDGAKAAAAAAVGVAAIGIGYRYGFSRIFSSGKNELAPQLVPRLLAREAETELPKVPSLTLDPGFRYFQQSSGGPPTLYRWPANGKALEYQALPDVQRYMGNGVWRNSQRERLIGEYCKGWFCEKEDELTIRQAEQLISRIKGK